MNPLAQEPYMTDEDGPHYHSFVVAFTKVDESFPPRTMEKWDRGFVATDGWAANYRLDPPSIVEAAESLDRVVSSIESPSW
jgi:hypothetical protein